MSKIVLGSLDLMCARSLRTEWMECCGHMSKFYGQQRWGGESEYMSQTFEPQDIPFSELSLSDLQEGAMFNYEYDFGTSTEAQVIVMKRFQSPGRLKLDGLENDVLFRNRMLNKTCVECKEASPNSKVVATMFCEEHPKMYPLCDEHAGNDDHLDLLNLGLDQLLT